MKSLSDQHFSNMRRWLTMEAEAERLRLVERRKCRSVAELEKRGETLFDLVIADHGSGLGGRFLVTFVKRRAGQALPWNRFRVGTPVVLSVQEEGSNELLAGVVSAKGTQSIQVAFEFWPDGDRFRLDVSADEVTLERQSKALFQVEKAKGRTAQLREVLLGHREPKSDKLPGVLIATLNSSQAEAVNFALAAEDLAVIHGPPGTGKTTTICELIRQAVARGQRVLATAPSNTAVDNLLDGLVGFPLRAVRIGHPARVSDALQSHTLDALVERDPLMEVVHECMREAERISRQASKVTRGKPKPGYRQELRQEVRRMRDDARRMERQIVANILDRADVICATTTFDPDVLEDCHFDMAVIDEACQSTEAGSWPVVLKANKLVVAGDHCQLPPTVISNEASKEGFARSLMERLVDLLGDAVTRQLLTQYRMHHAIMDFSSRLFYSGTLVADSSVASHTLSQLEHVQPSDWTDTPLLFIDSAGANWDEEQEPDGESRLNPKEADLVVRIVEGLREGGVAGTEMAVIAPYAAQVRYLRERVLDPEVEIDTVDGFQGREKEAIIISLVRSNVRGEIGFLSDRRRMNVALTRARRKLIVIGDSATLGSHPFYGAMIEYFAEQNAYRTVWDGFYQL